MGPVDDLHPSTAGGCTLPRAPHFAVCRRQLTQAKLRPAPRTICPAAHRTPHRLPEHPAPAFFRLTYPAPGAIIALPCPLRAFGLHASNCLNRYSDDARRLPGLVQLEIIPPTTRGTLWRLPPRPTSSRRTTACRLGTVTCSPRPPHEWSLIRWAAFFRHRFKIYAKHFA
jgi:hypothetical protein